MITPKKKRLPPVKQWGLAVAGAAAYAAAEGTGEYRACCLALLVLLVTSLATFRDK